MTQVPVSTEFANLLTSYQRRLFGYIANFLPNPTDTEEVLQRVNVVLLAKASEFEAGTSFHSWALRVAHFEVLAFFHNQKRDQRVFSAELLDVFAKELADDRLGYEADTRKTLRTCIDQLKAGDRVLVRRHYTETIAVKQIAEELGRPLASVYRSLDRVRGLLLDCIERHRAEEAR